MASEMTFREKMDLYDKESLKGFASDLGIRKVSQLRKADLIERIAEEFLDPEKLYYRMAILDDDAMALLKEASERPMEIQTHYWFFDMSEPAAIRMSLWTTRTILLSAFSPSSIERSYLSLDQNPGVISTRWKAPVLRQRSLISP